MFEINIVTCTGFDSTQRKKLDESMRKLKAVMNSTELRDRIINFSCELGKKFEDNQGLTNQLVYERLIAAREEYTANANFVADLLLVLVKKSKPWLRRNPAIGYGNAGDKEIYTYSWWFDSAEDYEYAGHIAHEWSHKVGFDHAFSPTPTRDYSVPYAFGYIVEELAAKIP